MSTRLGSVVDLVTDALDIGEVPYVALESVEPGTGRLVADSALPMVAMPAAGAATAQRGDVLFGKLRPYLGKTWRVDRPVYVSTELMCLRPSPIVDPGWLGYLVASRPVVEWAVATSDGAKMPRTSWERLHQYRIRLPNVDEQHAIADYLDRETARIDALIRAKERMMRLLADQRDAYMSATLWQGNYRPVRLKFLTAPPTSGNRDHASFAPIDDGVPCLRGLNVRAGWIDRENLLRLSPDDHARHLGTRLHEGDVVVVRSGLAGAAAAIPPNLEDCNCVDLVIIRRSPKLVPKYLEQVINSREAREQVAQRSVGALLTHFNAVDAADLVVPFRDLSEQEQIVDGIDEFDERYLRMRASLDRQVNLLQERRQALITAAVTGEIKVPVAA